MKQSGGRLLLEWGVQQSLPTDAKITSLIVEKKEGSRGRWITVATLPPNKRSFMIEQPASDITYYRVCAENIYGRGSPIETSSNFNRIDTGTSLQLCCALLNGIVCRSLATLVV